MCVSLIYFTLHIYYIYSLQNNSYLVLATFQLSLYMNDATRPKSFNNIQKSTVLRITHVLFHWIIISRLIRATRNTYAEFNQIELHERYVYYYVQSIEKINVSSTLCRLTVWQKYDSPSRYKPTIERCWDCSYIDTKRLSHRKLTSDFSPPFFLYTTTIFFVFSIFPDIVYPNVSSKTDYCEQISIFQYFYLIFWLVS